jgi:hypothetical protein
VHSVSETRPLGCSTRLGHHRCLGLVVVLALGCAASGNPESLSEFGAPIYEGDQFEVWASDGLVACGGTHAYTEAWLAAFHLRLGEFANPQFHRFYWLDDEDLAESPCPGDHRACAFATENVVYTTLIPDEHEVVHVELGDLRAPSFLNEGVAELYGSTAGSDAIATADLRAVITENSLPGPAYEAAGRLSRYLVDTYGQDAYFELLQTARPGDDDDALTAAFLSAFGEDLDAVFDAFEDEPVCDAPQWRYRDHECNDLPSIPWQDADHWVTSVEVACMDADVIGPRNGRIWTLRALDVSEGGVHALSVEGGAGAQAILESCDRSCFDGGPTLMMPRAIVGLPAAVAMLEAGHYWVQIDLPAGEVSSVAVRLERLAD